MLRLSLCLRVLACTPVRRCAGGASAQSATGRTSQRIKEQVEEQLDKETKAMSRVACYPHHSVTRPVLPVSRGQLQAPIFTNQLQDTIKIATDLGCVSFSAPKVHWDAAVILVKGSPDDAEFDIWVNPDVPGYDDRNSLAPMYGMWENCISCGVCNAWVLRPQKITCTGWDQHGNEKTEVLDGMRARCLMHELDHLRGKTILQQALGPEFVVSGSAMSQRDLWPVNFPSAEAYGTPPHFFFDYVLNTLVVPKGLEWWHAAQNMQQFDDQRLDR